MRIRLQRQVLARHIASSRVSQNRWAIRIGVSTGHLSELVNGKKIYPSPHTRERLLAATGLTFSQLFEVEHDREPIEALESRGEQQVLELSWGGYRFRVDRPGRMGIGRGKTVSSLIHDLRYGLRSMRRAPVVSLLAILTIALSIGGNAAIFSLVNAVLLKPLDFRNPGQLVMIFEHDRPEDDRYSVLSYPNFRDLRDRSRLFSKMAAFRDAGHDARIGEITERIDGARVSSAFFDLLGVVPAQGRFFGAEGDQPTTPRVAVVSEAFWRVRLGGDPQVVGHLLTIDSEPYEILGVLPSGFRFPLELAEAEIWTPIGLDTELLADRGTGYLRALGRLREGASFDAAKQELGKISEDLEREHETNRDQGVNLVLLHEHLVGSSRAGLLLLLAAVGVVLLIACANVASLTLARGAARQSEMAVRSALGAARGRLVRQLVTESLVIALSGGLLGFLLAKLAVTPMVRLLPDQFPRAAEINVDWRVFGFSLLISLLAALVFGVIPAFQNSKASPAAVLKQSGRSVSGGRGQLMRSVLIASQVALTLILLVGAGLLMRSFVNLISQDTGFNPENVLVFGVSRPFAENTVGDERLAYYQSLIDEVSAIPGVEVAGATTSMPFSSTRISVGVTPIGGAEGSSEKLSARYNSVSSDYFQTMRIPLFIGRYLQDQDRRGMPGVVVVNQAMADKVWPGESPLGRRIEISTSFDQEGEPTEFEVVGVIGNLRNDSLDTPAIPNFYVPHAQQTWPFMSIAVRTAGDPEDYMASVQRVVSRVDPDQSVSNLESLSAVVARSLVRERLALMLLAAFSALALLLASVGLYGVIAYHAARRIPEFGIRMAMGASRRHVLRLVLGRGIRLAALGVGLGLLGAFLTSRLLSGFLYQLSPIDPLTYSVVSGLVLGVALLACGIPAWRATRLDPNLALRGE